MKNSCIFVCLLFHSVACYTQHNTKNPPVSDCNSLLWKIEGNGAKKGCYLFGTMHLIEEAFFIFPKKLQKAVTQSELLVMEIPGVSNQLEAMKLLQLPKGSFFDFFTFEQQDSIANWVEKELHLNKPAFQTAISKMKPFVFVQLATESQFMGHTMSYEQQFESLAQRKKIPIKGLETVSQQIALFDNLSRYEQSELVMEIIRDTMPVGETSRKLEQLYYTQQIDSLYNQLTREKGIIASKKTTFIDQRNANWIPKIATFISEKRTFIAVGAGHLSGEQGLIQLLKKEGYTVTPIKLD
jgi:uncharacterized protein YbaP (TraB family)